MGYLKNKTFGFYLSFVAAILALIGFVMYRQSGHTCLLYTSPSPRDAHESRMPSSA